MVRLSSGWWRPPGGEALGAAAAFMVAAVADLPRILWKLPRILQNLAFLVQATAFIYVENPTVLCICFIFTFTSFPLIKISIKFVCNAQPPDTKVTRALPSFNKGVSKPQKVEVSLLCIRLNLASLSTCYRSLLIIKSEASSGGVLITT